VLEWAVVFGIPYAAPTGPSLGPIENSRTRTRYAPRFGTIETPATERFRE